MKRVTPAVAVVLSLLTVGCVSTTSIGYTDGWVTSSPVAYSFVGPPVLNDLQGEKYRVEIDGTVVSQSITALDRQGMHPANGHAYLIVRMTLGAAGQSEPGAIKIGKKWTPAFMVSMPYKVVVQHVHDELGSRSGTHSNALTFKGNQRFETREQAIAAIDTIRKLAQKGIAERARKGAIAEARQAANELATGLFAKRNISLEVPVVRSAAGLDLESCYAMLAEAEGPDQVKQALTAYERLGTNQRKPDGSFNKTASYGVACGIAAAKLMLRDLRGAWNASKVANRFEPNGEEVDRIRYVIYQQEKITGIRVIPEKDRAAITRHESMAGALEKLFGKPSN